MSAETSRPGQAIDPVLSVQNLTTSFLVEGKWKQVVRGISFDVASAETVAIVGESGSGKSTLALAALGGALAGYVGGTVFSRLESRKKAPAAYADPLADDEEILDA